MAWEPLMVTLVLSFSQSLWFQTAEFICASIFLIVFCWYGCRVASFDPVIP